eukprot:365145-Chlamydomonas_euryale.AAC.6
MHPGGRCTNAMPGARRRAGSRRVGGMGGTATSAAPAARTARRAEGGYVVWRGAAAQVSRTDKTIARWVGRYSHQPLRSSDPRMAAPTLPHSPFGRLGLTSLLYARSH